MGKGWLKKNLMCDCTLQRGTERQSEEDAFPYLGTNLLHRSIKPLFSHRRNLHKQVSVSERYLFEVNSHKLQNIHLRHTLIWGLAELLLFVSWILTNCVQCQCLQPCLLWGNKEFHWIWFLFTLKTGANKYSCSSLLLLLSFSFFLKMNQANSPSRLFVALFMFIGS